jgi:predicted permease
MSFDQSVIQSVGILVGMILMAMFLRDRGVLKEEHGGLFAKLITTYTLPCVIFTALSTSTFDPDKLLLAGVMIVSQVLCALLAWGVSLLLKLSKPRKGALILASTFTSSAFLGYAVVKQIYLGNDDALADAAIVSELGVAMLIFTLGVVIAMHFGTSNAAPAQKRSEALKFFRSPIFISLVAGIAVSFTPINHSHWIAEGAYSLLRTIGAANTLLVTLTIGVMLHVRDFRKVWWIVLIACVLKLVVQPALSYAQAGLFAFPTLWTQISVLEAAMPTAAMTAIFAKRYGCDAELTTILIFATFVSSIGTVVMMVWLLN